MIQLMISEQYSKMTYFSKKNRRTLKFASMDMWDK